MDEYKIRRLGRMGYSRSIEPLKSDRRWQGPIVGFDTEYNSKTSELICFQLWHGDTGVLVPVRRGEKLTPNWLYHECVRLVGSTEEQYLLITYFSLAELQHLPVQSHGFDIREYSSGSVDVVFAVKGCHLRIFDLQRWFSSPNQPLKKAAKSFGFRKLDWDTRHVTRSCLKSARFRKYALNDAKIQHDIAVELRRVFLEETGIDPIVSKTPAGSSAAVMRRRYVRKKLYCDNNAARLTAMRGTWGARAEAFERGKLKGSFTEYDFKSAYPTSALMLRKMPVQKCWKSFRSVASARRLIGGFCHVRFSFPKNHRFPCLPVDLRDARIFPLSGQTHCTLAEARVACEHGADVQVIEGYGYSDGTSLLADYLAWTLEHRAKSKHGARHMWKLLGNSLVGKFAQNLSRIPFEALAQIAKKLDLYLDEVLDLNPDEVTALAQLAGLPDPVHVSIGPVFMPEWNGLITGWTRAALAEMVYTGDPVYCHTDGVWCRKKPRTSMLKFDEKVSGPVTVIRRAFACIGRDVTAKRVKSEKVHAAHHGVWNLTAAVQMLRAFRGEDFSRKYPVRRPLKLREAIKSRRRIGQWVTEWRTGNTAWDCKRELLPDGTTRPWADSDAFTEALTEAKRSRRKSQKGKERRR